jgi:hypothetical protein
LRRIKWVILTQETEKFVTPGLVIGMGGTAHQTIKYNNHSYEPEDSIITGPVQGPCHSSTGTGGVEHRAEKHWMKLPNITNANLQSLLNQQST